MDAVIRQGAHQRPLEAERQPFIGMWRRRHTMEEAHVLTCHPLTEDSPLRESDWRHQEPFPPG